MSPHVTNFISRLLIAAALILLHGVRLAGVHAQASAGSRLADVVEPLPVVGEAEDERSRVRQLLGREPMDGYLLRSPSSMLSPLPGPEDALRWSVVAPSVQIVRNSAIPYSPNTGALWAGRGWSVLARTGVRVEYDRFSLVLAPQLVRSQNRYVQTVPSTDLGHSSLVPPWYIGGTTADLPYRPGVLPYTSFDLGQSSISIRAGGLTVGGATENQWWGPGIRNAIVLSNNAAGFPHLFLRTSDPVRTRFGTIEAKWLVGALTESLFFDVDPTNDHRSISAVIATFRPAAEERLTLGLARSVYGEVESAGRAQLRLFDVLRYWNAPVGAGGGERAAEQILSLFARWVFPASGFEAHAEWARLEIPSSVRDFLVWPHHTQGYTIGLQWAQPLFGTDRYVRIQSEATYLEQSSSYRQRPTPVYYASSAVAQGYTHRGQALGAAIGPGASSQWLAADIDAPRWGAGVFGGRIRWDNDGYYRQPTGRSEVAHDVSVLGGLRGFVDLAGTRVAADLTWTRRYNFLFQSLLRGYTGEGAVDLTNHTVGIVVSRSPRARQPVAPSSDR